MVPLSPEVLFSFKGIHITDAVTATILTDIVILGGVLLVYRGMALRPKRLQNVVEMVIEYFYTLTEQTAGSRAAMIFPWFASFFIFIVTSNILGLLPGYGLLEIRGHDGNPVPFFRAPSSDLNTTLALAVVSVAATHILSVRSIGIKNYLKRFISWSPILLFVGMLELVSEFTKLISFSFRLFGNIFAGEIVLGRISTMMAFVAPIPFILLELIVAVVQALVFAMLTMAFMSILTTSEGGGH
ncbi:MAG: F0F1 ATP synthase subunit A [Endomicrobiales bacterium]